MEAVGPVGMVVRVGWGEGSDGSKREGLVSRSVGWGYTEVKEQTNYVMGARNITSDTCT